MKDVAQMVAPFGRAEAAQLVRSIRAYPILTGARGRRPADIKALEDTILTSGPDSNGLPGDLRTGGQPGDGRGRGPGSWGGRRIGHYQEGQHMRTLYLGSVVERSGKSMVGLGLAMNHPGPGGLFQAVQGTFDLRGGAGHRPGRLSYAEDAQTGPGRGEICPFFYDSDVAHRHGRHHQRL